MEYTALSIFCQHYAPATKQNATDYFTSRQIADLINSHSGEYINPEELYKSLTEMGYHFDLVDDQFQWMMMKEDEDDYLKPIKEAAE